MINGYPFPGEIDASVTWTLRYEWEFYLLILPLSAFFALRAGWHLWFTGAVFLALIVVTTRSPQSHSAIALLEFFGGMLCASIQERFKFEVRWGVNIVLSLVVSGLLTLLMRFDTAYLVAPFLVLWGVFLLITSGCSIFGLLSSRAARRLGELSYSMYLLHGIVLYGIFSRLSVVAFARLSALHFWVVIAVAGALAVGVSMLSHVMIEVPGINFGRRLSRSIGNKV